LFHPVSAFVGAIQEAGIVMGVLELTKTKKDGQMLTHLKIGK